MISLRQGMIMPAQLAELKGLKESGMVSRYYETLDATLDIWKREYRMSLT